MRPFRACCLNLNESCNSTMSRTQKTHRRIFFALWPNDNIRQQLSHAFNASPYCNLPGKLYKPENLHLTLHFIGHVDAQQFNCMQSCAEKVQASAFNLQIQSFGVFKRAQVLWLAAKNNPAALNDVYSKLATELTNCGYIIPERLFNPHITLMRKFKSDVLPGDNNQQLIKPIEWQVNDFVLVESITTSTGVQYLPLTSYPLNR